MLKTKRNMSALVTVHSSTNMTSWAATIIKLVEYCLMISLVVMIDFQCKTSPYYPSRLVAGMGFFL